MLKRPFIANETNKKYSFSQQLENKDRMLKMTTYTLLFVLIVVFTLSRVPTRQQEIQVSIKQQKYYSVDKRVSCNYSV